MEIRRVELTAQERRVFLARGGVEWLRDAALAVVGVSFAALSMGFAVHGAWGGALTSLLLSGMALTCFVYCWLPRRRQAKVGKKEIIRGVVGRKRRSRGRRPAYFVFVGDVEVRIDSDDWRRLRLGDEVELHRATHGDHVFAVYRHYAAGPKTPVPL